MRARQNENRYSNRVGKMAKIQIALCGLLFALLPRSDYLAAAEPDTTLIVDVAKPLGPVKALHGVNHGPLANGENARLNSYHAEAGFPSTRLHDCHWPFPDVVDVSCIFPLFNADPEDPQNYLFAKTDAYLAAIVANHSSITYRLGQSIEPWTRYHTDPPADFQKWTTICLHIIRHYNEGWDNGFHYGIRYWEIWNETEYPDMWHGTQEQYFALYETAAKAIKSHDATLKVGGPAAAGIHSKRVEPFLAFCREKKLPLDFFSWHAYHGNPDELVTDAAAARELLDKYGFTNTESQMNEWRYLPTFNGLRPVDRKMYENGSVRRLFEDTRGIKGASFCVAALLKLQNSPLDMANYYCAGTTPWSMFDEYGVPSKVYYAFKAFNQLAHLPTRISCEGSPTNGLTSCAAISADKKTIGLLLGNFDPKPKSVLVFLRNAPENSNFHIQLFRVDTGHDFDQSQDAPFDGATGAREEIPSYGVCFMRFSGQ
jgi:xylan 1,4-beta-xylosidase